MAENDDRPRRERDMVLAPNEYVYVSDETKGEVNVFVGPTKLSLSNTDQPVIFSGQSKRFEKVDFSKAIQTSQIAPEGWYIVLKNPTRDSKRPTPGQKNSSADLEIGRKISVPGPISICLWPGQMAKVLQGHHLRSNQYLLVRIYDEDAARQNWKRSVIKPSGSQGSEAADQVAAAAKDPDFVVIKPEELTMGKLLIIKGTEVSFYIPPTGVEVVADEHGGLVREAVTLETLEYVLLMDENGNKRYERGPAVVFPEPTEIFVERKVRKGDEEVSTRKFKAIELNENNGIYLKVISDYEEGGREYKTGEELFLTGRDQMIYFPREEHAIIRYDGNEINYGIAIPAGEARYVLDRNKGNVTIKDGPSVFLPDPRSQVIVRRILDYKMCSLLYPSNHAALEHNAKLAGVDMATYMADVPVAVMAVAGAMGPSVPGQSYGAISANVSSSNIARALASIGDTAEARGMDRGSARGFSGDSFVRKTNYTEPRTITLPTKFDGAVSMDVWTGYAVMLVRKSGERRVVQGPKTVMLEYDEVPQILELSTGKPKTTDKLLRTVFLLTAANMVSDLFEVETKDFCKLNVKLTYRVNFEGDPRKWFDVENYVKFLCDHMRSKVRNAVRKQGVEDFYLDASALLRTMVLGESHEGGRPGTSFAENGMRIYDVEVLMVQLSNKDVEEMLSSAQKDVIRSALTLASERRKLAYTRESETIKQQLEESRAETASKTMELQAAKAKQQLELDLVTIEAAAKAEAERIARETEAEGGRKQIAQIKADTNLLVSRADIALDKERQEVRLLEIQAQVQAVVDKAKAVSPQLVAALEAFGERAMVETVAKAMAPLGIIGGESVLDVLAKLLAGSPIAKHLLTSKENGTGSQPRA